VEGNTIEPNRIDGIKAGMEIYRNYDHRFTQSVERSRIRRAIDVSCHLELSAESVVARYSDSRGDSVEVVRMVALEEAKSVDKMRSVAEEQMAKSGDSIFRVTAVEVVGANYFATAKLLAELRREAILNARAKANEIATAIDQSIGSCIYVIDYNSGGDINFSARNYANRAKGYSSADFAAESEVFVPEFTKERVEYSLQAKFELHPQKVQ
jgi:hypothetical protein